MENLRTVGYSRIFYVCSINQEVLEKMCSILKYHMIKYKLQL